MVNAQGGINGRKLVLAYNLDDGGQPSQFTQLTHTLIDQDHAFAVMVASYWFTPNYFVETHTPTYGYNVSGNWQGPDNLFAAGGSVQNYSAGVPGLRLPDQQDRSKNDRHHQLRAARSPPRTTPATPRDRRSQGRDST